MTLNPTSKLALSSMLKGRTHLHQDPQPGPGAEAEDTETPSTGKAGPPGCGACEPHALGSSDLCHRSAPKLDSVPPGAQEDLGLGKKLKFTSKRRNEGGRAPWALQARHGLYRCPYNR